MNMKDEETRKVLWSSEDWADVFEKETAGTLSLRLRCISVI